MELSDATEHRPVAEVFRSALGRVIAIGEFDVATTPLLARALADALDDAAREHETPQLLVLDLERVSFWSAAATNALVAIGVLARSRGVRLSLRHPSPPVSRVLDACGLGDDLLLANGGEREPA